MRRNEHRLTPRGGETISTRITCAFTLLVAVVLAAAGPAAAQPAASYPSRPIRFIVPLTMVPAGVPAGNIARIQAEIARTLAQQGTEVASSPTQELVTLIREDYARYGKLIKDAGIKGE